MTAYLLRHLQVFFFSLGQMVRAPFATLMTIAVIGITLALPAGAYVMVDNVQRVGAGWDGNAKISLFLQRGTSEKAANRLAKKIRAMASVTSVDYISADAALSDFKRLSGFGKALDALDYNPLPPALIVHPQRNFNEPVRLQGLVRQLGRHGEVELAQLDLEWVKRLHAMLQVARRGVWILASVLGLAVVLIIGNTIRLAVLNRREEIEVIKLVGGTNAFIRRPFLYTGLLQGVAGGLTASFLVSLGFGLLAGPIRDLASLYASQFRTAGLGMQGAAALVVLGGLLGWLGSRIAVGRHLRDIEPR
ncbi:MAG: permease-like cell division protein FtsX [Acidiferrobacterales bacterium]